MCGGTGYGEPGNGGDQGLSPRVRGNPDDGYQHSLADGSIPACAGEPLTRALQAAVSEVYPRVCGGTRLRLNRSQRRNGLSPRVRGEPIAIMAPSPILKVYPRVCGGTPIDGEKVGES